MKQLWVCPRCQYKVVLFVTPSEPPTCVCKTRFKGSKEPVKMKQEETE